MNTIQTYVTVVLPLLTRSSKQIYKAYARFGVSTAILLRIQVVWEMTQRRIPEYLNPLQACFPPDQSIILLVI